MSKHNSYPAASSRRPGVTPTEIDWTKTFSSTLYFFTVQEGKIILYNFKTLKWFIVCCTSLMVGKTMSWNRFKSSSRFSFCPTFHIEIRSSAKYSREPSISLAVRYLPLYHTFLLRNSLIIDVGCKFEYELFGSWTFTLKFSLISWPGPN